MNQPRGLPARAFLSRIRLGETRVAVGLAVVDFLLAATVFWVAGRLVLHRSFSIGALGILTGTAFAGLMLAEAHLRSDGKPRWLLIPKVVLGNLAAALIYSVLRRYVSGVVGPGTFAEILAALVPLQLLVHGLHAFVESREPSVPSQPSGSGGWIAALFFPLRWLVETERNGRWCFSLMLADGLLAGSIAFLVGAYGWEIIFDRHDLLVMAGLVIGANLLTLTYAHRLPNGPGGLLAKLGLGSVLAWVGWLLFFRHGTHLTSGSVPLIVGLTAPAQALLHVWHRRQVRRGGTVLASLQWAILLPAALSLHWPLLNNGSIGAGDSYWYRLMVADFLSQWRAGFFPVFTGQSEFAFNGAVSPLRLAPALQHLSGLLDLLTLHQLPFHGVLNLALTASYVGGTFTCFACLRSILPRSSWFALVLSVLFACCPGILALAYVGDLYMSITTLPFVPLVLYGAWRTHTKGDLAGTVIMG